MPAEGDCGGFFHRTLAILADARGVFIKLCYIHLSDDVMYSFDKQKRNAQTEHEARRMTEIFICEVYQSGYLTGYVEDQSAGARWGFIGCCGQENKRQQLRSGQRPW